jgi:threonine synthase
LRPLLVGFECPSCGARSQSALNGRCEGCLVPLDAAYDYDRVRFAIGKTELSDRPHNLWRWNELLPVSRGAHTGAISGWTPLVHAQRLGAHTGLENLYLKLEVHSAPTFSYKDRVVAVAVQHALESGAAAIGCVSTGNVGNSLAALAARPEAAHRSRMPSRRVTPASSRACARARSRSPS